MSACSCLLLFVNCIIVKQLQKKWLSLTNTYLQKYLSLGSTCLLNLMWIRLEPDLTQFQSSPQYANPNSYRSVVGSRVFGFRGTCEDLRSKLVLSLLKQNRLNSAASLGTGEGQHSQAQHARELRSDTGQDHKPEYAERGRWRSYNFANFPWRSDFLPDRLSFERFEKKTHKYYAKFGLHLCLLAPALIFSARAAIFHNTCLWERETCEKWP